MQEIREKSERYGLRTVDTWWVVLAVDPIAMRIIDVIRHTRWITPNRISVAAIIVGCFTAFEFASGSFAVGAALFQLRFLLDCIDGKLARVRGQQTRLGWYLDHGLTFPVSTLIGFGWAYGLHRVGWQFYGLTMAALFFVGMANYLLFAFEQPATSDKPKKRALIGRLNPRPTLVECELVLFTIFPILTYVSAAGAKIAFVSGLVGVSVYSAYMFVKQLLLSYRESDG